MSDNNVYILVYPYMYTRPWHASSNYYLRLKSLCMAADSNLRQPDMVLRLTQSLRLALFRPVAISGLDRIEVLLELRNLECHEALEQV